VVRSTRIWPVPTDLRDQARKDLVPFREPDKNPTEIERLRCTEDFYPELV